MRFSLSTWLRVGFVMVLSAMGAYAFSASPSCHRLADLAMKALPWRFPPYPFILFILLLLLGLLSTYLAGKPSQFIFLVFIFSLPSILPFSAIGWLKALGLELALKTRANFDQMLTLVLLLGLGYVILSHTQWLKEVGLKLLNLGAESEEVKEVYRKGHLWTFIVAGGAVLAAALSGLASLKLKLLIVRYISLSPLNIVLIGTICTLMLFIGLYLFLLRNKPSVD